MPVDSDHSPAILASKRLYLFDIDGTLITSGGAGENSFRDAVIEVCGGDAALEGVNFAGNTDTGIAREVLLAAGMEPSQENIRYWNASKSGLTAGLPCLQAILRGEPR